MQDTLNVIQHSELTKLSPEQAQIQFFVDLRTSGHKKIRSVTCPVSWTIAQLKAYLGTDSTLSISRQGKQLRADQTVKSAGIQANETVTIMMPLPGGALKLFSKKVEKQVENPALANSYKASQIREHFFEVEKNKDVTLESKKLLQGLLKQTSFFPALNTDQKLSFLSMFTQEQISGLQRIDKNLGYVNDDSSINFMYEALNLLTPDERVQLLDAMQTALKDNGNMRDTYMKALYESNEQSSSLLQFSANPLMNSRNARRDTMNMYIKNWKFNHVFKQGEQADDYFFQQLRAANNLPSLRADKRLQPLIQCFTKQQKLEVILRFINEDQLGLAQDFMQALRTDNRETAWTMLQKLIPTLQEENRKHALEIMEVIEDENTDLVLAQTLILRNLDALLAKQENASKEEFKSARSEFLTFWDSSKPATRKELVKQINQTDNKIKFFKLIDLDDKVDYLDLLGTDEERNKFWDSFTPEEHKRALSEVRHHQYFHLNEEDSEKEEETAEAKQEELLNVLKKKRTQVWEATEKEEEKKEEDGNEVMIQEEIKVVQEEKLTEFSSHLKKVESEMQEAWSYLPQHMAGNYRQCLPNPQKETQFILIQPKVMEDNSANYTKGKLDNPNQPNKKLIKNEEKCSIYQGSAGQAKESRQTFSVVSYWDYTQSTRSFDCDYSFITKPIICLDFLGEKTNQQYLFQGKNGTIFFFNQEKVQTAENDAMFNDNNVYLCVLKGDNSYDNYRKTKADAKAEFKALMQQRKQEKEAEASGQEDEQDEQEEEKLKEEMKNRNFNLDMQIKIEQGSPLYQFVKPNLSHGFSIKADTRFNQAPPQLLDCGPEAGQFLVFSLFRRGDSGPTLYFHSLNTNKCVAQVSGGEMFVDFIAGQDDKARGSLYFLTDRYFFETKWQPIKEDSTLSKICRDGEVQLVRAEFSLHPRGVTSDLVGALKPQPKQGVAAMVVSKAMMSQKEMTKLLMPDSSTVIKMQTSSMYRSATKFPIQKSSNWITSIEPLQRNAETQELSSFAIVVKDHVTTDSIVRIMQLEGQNYTQMQTIEQSHLKWAYVHRIQQAESTKSVIQVFVEQENQYELKIFMPSDSNQASRSKNMTLVGKPKATRYMQQPTKIMSRKVGQFFTPMQVGMRSNSDTAHGCFLDQDNLDVNWFHIDSLRTTTAVNKYQITAGTTPEYTVEYPVLCYLDAMPDKRQLVLCNLADAGARSHKVIKLENLQFICFVSHRQLSDDQTKVCFLAEDHSEQSRVRIVHCIINCEKMFQKKQDNDLSYLKVDKEYLGVKSEGVNFKNKLSDIVKVESVHSFMGNNQCYVFQYQNGIYVYNKDELGDTQTFQYVSKERMKPLVMQRGFNNTFYFVESDTMGTTDFVMELSFKEVNSHWSGSIKSACSINTGTIMALEMDPNSDKQDTGLMSDGTSAQRFVTNELFILEDSMQLYKLVKESEDKFELTEKQNLSEFPQLQIVLKNLKTERFPRLSISDTCLTIGNMNVSLTDKMDWEFSYEDLPSIPELEDQAYSWIIKSVVNIDSTHRQILCVARQWTEVKRKQFAFVVKTQPSSRAMCLIGKKLVRNVEMVEYISDKLLLIKLRGNYWAMLDTMGHIQEIPPSLLEILNEVPFDLMTSTRLDQKGKMQLMLESETHTTVLLFDHYGKIVQCDRYQCEVGDELDESQCNIASIFSDSKGQAYRIFNKQVEGETEPSLREQEIIVTKQDSKDTPGTFLFNIAFLVSKKDTVLKTFQLCGDYLVWQRPEVSPTIYLQQLHDNDHRIKNQKDSTGKRHTIYPEAIEFDEFLNQDKAQVDFNINSAPKSTHLSQRTQHSMSDYHVNENLLQVTIGDRALILDLNDKEWIKDFSDMQQLIAPQDFVCSEVNIENCFSEETRSLAKDYRFVMTVVHNSSKDFFLVKKLYRTTEKEKDILEPPHLIPRKYFGAYNTHNEIDLVQLKRIAQATEDKKPLVDFDIECLLSMYKGKSIFSMQEEPNLYGQIETVFLAKDFEPDIDDEDEHEMENSQLRRLFQVLMTPQPKLIDKFEKVADTHHKLYSMYSLLEMIPYSNDDAAAAKLMNISINCNGTSLIVFADTQADVRKLLNGANPQVKKILEHSFIESQTTRMITKVRYPQGIYKAQHTNLASMAFSHNSCLITKKVIDDKLFDQYREAISMITCHERCQEKAKCNEDMVETEVKVQMLDLGWLYTDGQSFKDFVDFLGTKTIIMTDFSRVMLDSFWQNFKDSILWYIFMPYIMYLFLTIYYMTEVVCQEQGDAEKWQKWMGCINLIFLAYQLKIECTQARGKCWKHITGTQNLMDLCMYTLNGFMTVITLMEYDKPELSTRRVIVSVMLLFMWIKMKDLLRLFDTTAFFIKLILVTMQDIIPFIMILPIFIFAIGTSMYILNMARGDNNQVMDSMTGFWPADVFIGQYLLSLGDWDTETFPEGPNAALVEIFFLLATFFTAVTALNMLIAIMGDTFGKVLEGYETASREMKLEILKDYMACVYTRGHENNFIVLVKPVEIDPEDDWGGAISMIKASVEKSHDSLNEKFNAKIDLVKELVAEFKTRQTQRDRETQKLIQDMIKNQAKMETDAQQRDQDMQNLVKETVANSQQQ